MHDRAAGWELLCEFTKNENLRKHALVVEGCLRAYAVKWGEDVEFWGLVGLIHDFDYERWPEAPDHPAEGSKILRERGWPEEIIRAIQSHADYMNVPRVSRLEKTLFACDELAGFITACALVRPNKSIMELEARSVTKRFKDKAFARSVNRQDILKGAEELGVPIEEHVNFCIQAMRGIAGQLGLAGNAGGAQSGASG